MSKQTRQTGRQIRSYAAAALRELKKMLSLIAEAVKESILVKVGDECEYESGKTEVDFINFVMYRMYN